MKIGTHQDLPALDGPAVRSARTAPATPAAGGISPAAQVDVSAASVALARAGNSGDFDQAKVDAIRAAIQEGRFTVNAGAIADQLISDAAALLAPRSAS